MQRLLGRHLIELLAVLVAFCAVAVLPQAAAAVSIELKGAAPDRIDRQRAHERGSLPLPGTPNTDRRKERLQSRGLSPGSPVFIRIFKAESKVELWMQKDGVFNLFATYPVCNWSGTLGPKLKEGDRQTPEGFYTVTRRQLHRRGRWRNALNLGFPNAYDRALDRSGSYILVHGGCSTVGCFAMTDTVAREIYALTSAALYGGQRYVPVHVFPFRMTQKNLAAHANSPWFDFWSDLKQGYDAFERTKRLPRVSVCEGRYHIEDVPAQATPAESKSKKKNRKTSSRARIRVACPPKDTQTFEEAAANETRPFGMTEAPTRNPQREAKQQ